MNHRQIAPKKSPRATGEKSPRSDRKIVYRERTLESQNWKNFVAKLERFVAARRA